MMTRFSVAVVLAGMIFLGCTRNDSQWASADPSDDESNLQIAIQLNWYPEAEHGGAYDAVARDLFARQGIEVEIRPGGRATPVAAELSLGRCDFAITNADDVVLFRQQGAKIVALMAAMQQNPRCILVRAEAAARRLEQLKTMTLERQPGRGFLEFMRSRGLLEGVREVPYSGSVIGLVRDPSVAIQAYSIAEPFLAEQQDVAVRKLMLSDTGWNPYASVLVTTEKMIREQPDLVRRVVEAVTEGWRGYVESPGEANSQILAANSHGMTAEALAFGSREIASLVAPDGDTAAIGDMSAKRWETLVMQMREIDLVSDADVKAADCFTRDFLPGVSTPP